VHEFTVGSRAIVCKKFHFEGGLPGNFTEITIAQPKYEECTTTPVLGTTFPVTVTFGNCYYKLTGEKTNALKYAVSLHLECENLGEEVVMHVKNGAKDICTLTIKPQTTTGPWFTNGGGSPDDIVLHSDKDTTFDTTIHGALCGGTEETNKEFEAIYESTTTFTGFQGGDRVDLTVSHQVI
jgi:hypothetical protein